MNHCNQVAAHRSVRDCIDSAVDVDPSNLGLPLIMYWERRRLRLIVLIRVYGVEL